MNTDRRIAITAGILFIVATAASLVGSSFIDTVLNGPDPLANIAASAIQMSIAALLTFVAAAGSAGIAYAMYPYLKRYSQGLAIGAVGFRTIEAVFYLVGVVCLLGFTALGQQFVHAGGQDTAAYQMVGSLLLAMRDLASFVFGVMAFCLGAFLYYYEFYRYNLIPRWLSIWGLIAIVAIFVAVIITLFDGGSPEIAGGLLILVLPIAVQEMVLAVWLIVKGFNPSAIASAPATADMD